MKPSHSLTEGPIFGTLIRFSLPVLLALFLQALYGGVDLLVVGRFARTGDVSGVATGSMLMHTVTSVITGLAMGITILIGRRIGEGRSREAGEAVGSGITLFTVLGLALTALMVLLSEPLARLMQAPPDAFEQTAAYLRICGAGSLFIVAYNVLGSIFRGIGDSATPLITVAIACALNIGGDLLFVAVWHMGAAGAALATVIAQGISVVISFLFIRRKTLPFRLSRRDLLPKPVLIQTELRLGIPIALQDFLVGISFLIIQAVVNSIGVVESAAVGVGEKLCAFLMLVPIAYMQSMSAFVAQNRGAGKPERNRRALRYGIFTSVAVGVCMACLAFFDGSGLAALFDRDPVVIAAAHNYLMAYGIDCVMTPFLFCFIGYFNGYEKTLFVMIQGLIGAFGIRVPVVFLMSRLPETSLFRIGLATPISTAVQITLCMIVYVRLSRREKHTVG